MVAIHDAFGLYGRDPIHGGYTWDPRDHVSMMFAYPVGPLKEVILKHFFHAEPLTLL
jgi:CCR4-NOT transcriptional complex subunit CAF120